MPRARLVLDAAFALAPVPRRLFGSFVEHMGRCVYTGIFEPDHPTADAAGFRGDVLELTRRLGAHRHALPGRQLRVGVPLGGRHRTGGRASVPVGPGLAVPRAQHHRPARVRRLGPAGRHRGDDGGEPRHPRSPGGLRPARVHQPPGRDLLVGPPDRQRGQGSVRVPPLVPRQRDGRAVADRAQDRVRVRAARRRDRSGDAAGRRRHRAGRMRLVERADADLRGLGERGARAQCYDTVDYVSLHVYYSEHDGDTDSYLASAVDMDGFIEAVVSTADAVRARGGTPRRSTCPSTSGTSPVRASGAATTSPGRPRGRSTHGWGRVSTASPMPSWSARC